jgi:hypothetical protein
MAIEKAMQLQEWHLAGTDKWIAVNDLRLEFHQAFYTHRVGKIIGSKFYITLSSLSATARQLIIAHDQPVESIVSTSGRGNKYPGIECSHVPPTLLFAFFEQLRLEIDLQIQKKLYGNGV